MQRSDAENARRASRGQSRKVQSDASQTRRNTSPDMSAPLLLIVEDELAIQELIVFVCEAEGFRTTRAGSIAEARSALAAERPDLILLDRMLPDRPGEEWLRELRSDTKTADVPVIILTARGNESDRVAGLDAGADDYVVKPFLPRELTARVRAVLRRRGAAVIAGRLSPMPSEETASTADEERFEATAAGKPLKLSAKEFKLLSLFAAKPGRVFSRANLLDAVWQSAFVDERTVDVHMLRLRKALAGSAAEDMIETVRGVGYRFRDPQTALNTPASE